MTTSIMGDLTLSLEDRIEEAINTARGTFQTGRTRPLKWRITQLKALKTMLDEHEHAFCSALYRDLGKSYFEANYIELDNVRNSCDFFVKNLKKLMKPKSADVPWYMKSSTKAKVIHEPLGVVLIFSAWNYPLLLALDPLVAAIAAGNAVVVKPAECAKSMCLILKQLLPKYLDAHAVKVLEATKEECAVLLTYKFDKIFYTGSPRIGRIIMEAAAKHLTPVTLELGGKSPAIVDSTADIFTAARRLAATKWMINCGQTCIAPDYVLVHSDVTSLFLEGLKQSLLSFMSPLLESANTDVETDQETDFMPRIINKESLARLQTLLDEVQDSVVFKLGETDTKKLTMMPTILLNPSMESKIMQEEIFGPILPVLQVHNMEEAINFVCSRPQPLALYMFTSNKKLAKEVVEKTSSGSVVINDAGTQFGLESIPFGGIGESGMGSYHGRYGFDTFSHQKGVVTTQASSDDPIRYPPYSAKNKAILRACLRNKSMLDVILIKLGMRKF
ncbi:hypothetical protein KP509_13G072600 [Ceratopteris richardii]|uniref:Aldehyde dehydrogenase n=1 Tax=Ceratopteris richardii TaxID=49495 RepID=A0A8T2TK06_CERRI|nr:hypothetical protein KP509_13G072600 [Ceratopteris richardii]